VDLPSALTPATAAVAIWVAAASSEVLTGVVPAVVGLAAACADYVLWRRRQKPWHDLAVIVLLVPVLAAGLWVGIGGLLLDVSRGTAGRLLLEVGPGLALTGLAATLISYHGRHEPSD
jgi:hypothetical protein